MNIKDKHTVDKPVSAISLFKGEEGKVTAIQILKDQVLKAHSTKVPALLVCILGEAVFENEQGMKETLLSGDMIDIEPIVKHWVTGTSDSQLLLFR